jgi:flagellar hook-associated protein 2
LQNAGNAVFTLNGITMTRSSNLVSDALDGVSLRLNSTTGATPVQIGVTFDGTEIAAAVSRFAESYNLLNDFIKAATGPASEDNELAGTLQNNSSVRTIKNMLRNKLTARSSSASGDITHWSVLGVALDRNGVLQVDQAKVKENFESKPTDVIKALSNNAASPYIFSGSPSGLAGDMAVAVYGMVRSTGTLADLQKSYADTQARTEKQQTKLDQDIERLEARYDRQFSALNAVLASFKETAKRLDSTFNQNKD